MNFRSDRCLSVVLLEDIDFSELVGKVEVAFGVNLAIKDKEGRCIAEGGADGFYIEVVDRVDRLGDFLSDDNHVVDIFVVSDEHFNSEFEDKIKSIFKRGGIKWGRAVWSRIGREEGSREIYPDLD